MKERADALRVIGDQHAAAPRPGARLSHQHVLSIAAPRDVPRHCPYRQPKTPVAVRPARPQSRASRSSAHRKHVTAGTMPSVTEVLTLDARHPDPAGIARAAGILRAGGLVAFPTETVYGLGAHALDADAVRRVFAAKGRPAEDPLIVHVHDVGALGRTRVDAVPAALSSARVTLLARSIDDGAAAIGGGTAGSHRRPRHGGHSRPGTPHRPRAHRRRRAIPIAAPSANLFSRPSPTRAEHVLAGSRWPHRPRDRRRRDNRWRREHRDRPDGRDPDDPSSRGGHAGNDSDGPARRATRSRPPCVSRSEAWSRPVSCRGTTRLARR